MEIVLTIAGSDPSAGAGIQQDLKTITAMGCYGATVITALTTQNTLGVQGVMAVPPEVVASQLQAVLADLAVRAVKIGQIPDRRVAEAVVATLQPYLAAHAVPVVFDPVMISTSGRRLMAADCIGFLCARLFPLCALVTPNLPEAEALLQRTLPTAADIAQAGHGLVARHGIPFLLKGGHTREAVVTDRLFLPGGATHAFTADKQQTRNLHGTGCTLSSAIAARLARGDALPEAVAAAKQFVDDAIRRSTDHGIGHGNGPLLLTDES